MGDTITRARFLTLLLSSAVAGAVGALVENREAKGLGLSYTLEVQPQAGDILTCGWHSGACDTSEPPGGSALDWDNRSDHQVRWRSWGACVGSCEGSTLGNGTAYTVTGGPCHEFQVRVNDSFDRTRGYVQYIHATKTYSGGTYAIYAGDNDYDYTLLTLGETIPSEYAGCAFYGEHLHQGDIPGAGTWGRNTFAYHWTGNEPDCQDDDCADGPFPVTERGYAQVSQSWTDPFK